MIPAHTNTLYAERKAHLANVQALEHQAPKLEPDAAARAKRTIANLKQQIAKINALLPHTGERAAP